jgi:hypothetical protein
VVLATIFNSSLVNEEGNLYFADYTACTYSDNSTYGNLVLVNPTNKSYSNLTLAIQVDGSEPINPTLRAWTTNTSLKSPNSFLESVDAYYNMNKSSIQAETVNIGPNQNVTVNLNYPSSSTFRFSAHNLTVYLSQHSLGDVINGQLLKIPQTETYLEVVRLSPVQYDNDTFHLYYDEYRNDNPNFLQSYRNSTMKIGAANYWLAAGNNFLGMFYFNVTVHNNSSFPVNSIALFGQLQERGGYFGSWYAHMDVVLQPGESYLFPVGEMTLPTGAYAMGYITNSTLKIANQTASP